MEEKKMREEFPGQRPEVKAVGQFVNLWMFMYGISASVKQTGVVQAGSEEVAVKVAEKWCEQMGFRFIGAKVRPMILADEGILKVAMERPA